MHIAILLRVTYLLCATAILTVYAVPVLRDRLLVYGARGQRRNGSRKRLQNGQSALERFVDYVASIKVSHNWFMHFYMVSVISSMVWLQQLYTRGPILQFLLSGISRDDASMSFNQIILCWTLLAIQGSRRLYECMILARPSRSEMWIGHYLLGLLYYIAMSIAIWIEGAPALSLSKEPLGDATISAPSIVTFLFLPVFLFASGIQFDTHLYLNSLREYALPAHPAFQRIISPHYTAECGIYLSLTFLAAPKGHLVNKTLLTALAFVVVELGVSADMTKSWYKERFGVDSVQDKRRMIPGIW